MNNSLNVQKNFALSRNIDIACTIMCYVLYYVLTCTHQCQSVKEYKTVKKIWFFAIHLPIETDNILCQYYTFILQWICSYAFYPLSLLMGVGTDEAREVGKLVGIKVFATELLAFQELGESIRNGLSVSKQGYISQRSCAKGERQKLNSAELIVLWMSTPGHHHITYKTVSQNFLSIPQKLFTAS